MQKLIEMFPLIGTDPETAARNSVFFVIAITALLFIIFAIVAAKREKKRVEQLRLHAEERGLAFEHDAEIPSKARRSDFFMNGRAYSKKASNLTSSVKAGHHVFDIFDYQYVTGSGKSRTLHQYACAFSSLRSSAGRFFPIFSLVPENIFYRIADKFTHSDIDFEYYPHFSSLYHLTGPSREQITVFFKPAILSCLESHPGLEIYCDGENITICKRGHLKAEQMAAFEDEAVEILQMMAM